MGLNWEESADYTEAREIFKKKVEKEYEALIVAFKSYDGSLVDILNSADDFELTYDNFGIPVDCTVYLTHSNPTIFIKTRDKAFVGKENGLEVILDLPESLCDTVLTYIGERMCEIL